MTTDDPRTAALAEALHIVRPTRCPVSEHHGANANRHMEDAAAILAALPPDWCGHGGAYVADYARLRRIEKAARYVDQLANQMGFDDDEWEHAAAALRAALGEDPR